VRGYHFEFFKAFSLIGLQLVPWASVLKLVVNGNQDGNSWKKGPKEHRSQVLCNGHGVLFLPQRTSAHLDALVDGVLEDLSLWNNHVCLCGNSLKYRKGRGTRCALHACASYMLIGSWKVCFPLESCEEVAWMSHRGIEGSQDESTPERHTWGETQPWQPRLLTQDGDSYEYAASNDPDVWIHSGLGGVCKICKDVWDHQYWKIPDGDW
jgi:hypothetical protein